MRDKRAASSNVSGVPDAPGSGVARYAVLSGLGRLNLKKNKKIN
jgi:hypothetical protein